MQSSFGQTIKKWRRLNHINQHKLAAKLGVTQQAVSAWERGIDEPSQKIKKKFQDLMNKNSALFIEKLFIKDQSTIRALVDTDGAKLIAYSSGFEKVWSDFTKYKDLFLEDKLINEIQSIVGNAEYKKQILAGEIVVLSGTSIQHLDINIDKLLLHNWHVCFRNLGGNIIGDIVMEPASLDEKLGIKNIIKMSHLGR